MSFEGLEAVVTGGTGALGGAVVRGLVEAGGKVYVPAFNEEELARFDFAGHPQVVLVQGVDLSREQDVKSFYDGVPRLWASIHCAGGFAMSRISDASASVLEKQIRLNLLTCCFCCREAVRRIREGSGFAGGRIVNVAARPALEPRMGAGMGPYVASKAAVAALTLCWGEELAEEKIWVNAVAPSILDTPANRKAMPNADFTRWPGVDEAAATILFLASPQNRATRSSVVPVYGAT